MSAQHCLGRLLARSPYPLVRQSCCEKQSDQQCGPRCAGGVGDNAKMELFAIRHLAVGKEAADIEGPDQDGKRFKLSDYRGKVVLLYFWQHV